MRIEYLGEDIEVFAAASQFSGENAARVYVVENGKFVTACCADKDIVRVIRFELDTATETALRALGFIRVRRLLV